MNVPFIWPSQSCPNMNWGSEKLHVGDYSVVPNTYSMPTPQGGNIYYHWIIQISMNEENCDECSLCN